MKKTFIILSALFASIVAIFFATNGADFSIGDFFQWLISVPKGFVGGVTGATEAALGTGDATSIATNLIMSYESFRGKAYTDATGNLTIGYGHKIVDGDNYDSTSVITEADAEQLLADDIGPYQQCVESAITQPMTPGQEAAMISLCYNIGCEAFSDSTLVSDFNGGDVDGASAQFLSWNKGHVQGVLVVLAGLASRRSSEQSVFNSASPDTSQVADNSGGDQDDPGDDSQDDSGDDNA